MRMSDLGRSKMMINTLNRNREGMDRLMQEASTGYRKISVAETPGDYGKLTRYKDAITLTDGFVKNIKNARNELNLYESLVNQITTTMRDVKALAIQASNDPGYVDSVTALRERANGILETMAGLANNSTKGEFMFAGSKNLTPAFEFVRDGTGKITDAIYRGDFNPRVFNPDTAERIEIDLTGAQIFEGPAGMGLNIFQELIAIRDDLGDTKFENKDQHLSTIDNIYNRLVNKMGEIGTATQHMDRLEDFMASYSFTLQEKAAEIEFVDLAETISALLNQEHTFRSSLEVAARLNNLTLLDYIR